MFLHSKFFFEKFDTIKRNFFIFLFLFEQKIKNKDSIDYLSSSWARLFKTGNNADPDTLDVFRYFHCADCLKSFQQQTSTTSIEQNNSKENILRICRSAVRMNTPPPALQPIVDETLTGLYQYFGSQPSGENSHVANFGDGSSINSATLAVHSTSGCSGRVSSDSVSSRNNAFQIFSSNNSNQTDNTNNNNNNNNNNISSGSSSNYNDNQSDLESGQINLFNSSNQFVIQGQVSFNNDATNHQLANLQETRLCNINLFLLIS